MMMFLPVFKSYLLITILLGQLLLSALFLPHLAHANTWFELGMGLNQASGSDQKTIAALASRALFGWGTHLQWMPKGDALYLCGSFEYDTLQQEGALALGSPKISRQLLTPSVGLRYYHALDKEIRLFATGGFGKTFSESSVSFTGLSQTSDYQSSSSTFSLELGVQYKLSAGLLLGLSFNQVLLSSPEALSLPEKALQIGRQESMTGWQRALLSLGFYL